MAVPQLPQFTVYPLVWNPDTLAYEPQVNSTGGSVASDVTVSNFPADGATGAKQTTGNASLASIDGKLGSPFQTGGSIGNTSFASPVADGANVVEGALADAAATAGGTGSLSAKLRAISRDLVANIVLAAGSAIIGKVGIDQTTPGTTNKVAIGTDGVVALGTGAAVIGHVVVDTAPTTAVTGPLTDTQLRASAVPVSLATAPTTAVTNTNLDVPLSTLLTTSDFDTKTGAVTETAPTTDIASSGLNGRLQRIAQRVSSLITALGSPFQAGGSIGNTSFASPVADGANVVEGAVADAVVAAGAAGTISAKLRAISRDLVANIVLAAGSAIIGKVGIDQTTPGTTNAVAQQGTWTVQPGNTANTTAWKVDGSAVTQPVAETRPATVTQTVADWSTVSDTTRAVTLLAANAARRGATVRNDTDRAIPIREGGTASATAYTDVLYPGDRYVLDYPASTALLSLYVPTIPSGSVYVSERTA